MAHRPSQRRNLAPPEPNPPSAPATKHPRVRPTPSPSHHPTPSPDVFQASKSSFLVKPFSSLNLGSHKTRAPPHKQSQARVDTLLQAKSMTTSAIFEKEGSVVPAKRTHKEKPQKPGIELERWKLHGLVKKNNEKKDHHHNKSMVEDVKVEKSRKSAVEEHGAIATERVSVSLAPGGGRRRSLCGSLVDLGDVFAINGAKMVSADMPPFMQIHAVDCARKAFDSMEKFTSKTLALSLKKVVWWLQILQEFDGVYGPAWHCIVGTSFGSFVTHSAGGFLYFSMDQKLYILLFKTAVQKAD